MGLVAEMFIKSNLGHANWMEGNQALQIIVQMAQKRTAMASWTIEAGVSRLTASGTHFLKRDIFLIGCLLVTNGRCRSGLCLIEGGSESIIVSGNDRFIISLA